MQIPACAGLIGDLADLGLGEARIGLQFQDGRPALLGAGEACEGGDGAGLGAALREFGEQRARIEQGVGEPDHPPTLLAELRRIG